MNKLKERDNLSGKRFGRLVVTSYYGLTVGKRQRPLWGCVCDCGNEKIVLSKSLISGESSSCGCGRIESIRKHYSEIPIEDIMLNRIYNRDKADAKRRNIAFELTKQDVKKLIFDTCYYCGNSPSNSNRFGLSTRITNLFHNGIDRIDNSKGYINGNVVSCCKQCNFAKGILTFEEFTEWVNRINNNLVDKGIV